jgi:hypothetical protein
VLASAEFSKEITTTVIWLNSFGINVSCVRVKPYLLDGQVLLNVEQIIPLPEAQEYQVRVRTKERLEREARIQDRDTTRFDLVIANESLPNLPKRRLVYHIARAAILAGAKPQDVLPDGRHWVVVDGNLNSSEFVQAAENKRTEDSSQSEIRRFYTAEGEQFYCGGRTYSMTKMWGASSLDTVDRIISRYKLEDIHYKAVEE